MERAFSFIGRKSSATMATSYADSGKDGREANYFFKPMN
jgi:hypothetical protein